MSQRALDLALGIPMLLLSLPVIAVSMLFVCLDSAGGPLFVQTRVGRAGRPFKLFKLRSFHEHRHGLFPDEEISWNDPRVTRVGSFLRRSKLDELPQLVNVLRGDMSLVGPRPDIPIQVVRYSEQESARLSVRPGLTGLAQISGNTSLSWPQRIQLDRWYIAHRCLSIDIAILLLTVRVVLHGERMTDDPLGIRAAVLRNSGDAQASTGRAESG